MYHAIISILRPVITYSISSNQTCGQITSSNPLRHIFDIVSRSTPSIHPYSLHRHHKQKLKDHTFTPDPNPSRQDRICLRTNMQEHLADDPIGFLHACVGARYCPDICNMCDAERALVNSLLCCSSFEKIRKICSTLVIKSTL